MTRRRTPSLWILIVASGALRLAWSASLGLGNDEAYHSLFMRHPDWSYFDHPPMLAVVERLGIALAGGTTSAFSLRIGFILLFAGSTWLMARLGTRFHGANAGFLAALALNATAYHSVAAGTFALPDGPLLFFWLLTLDRLGAALDAPERRGPWIGVGLAWGGALLSKYHAVFLPMGFLLYILIEPSARGLLRRVGPYLATATGLVLFAPVIAWNARHHWASFGFQGSRALGGFQFRPDTLVGAILGQAVYLFPWMWGSLILVLFQGLGRLRRGGATAGERFLLAQAMIPLAMFLAVACTRSVLPHWTLVGFLPLLPLLGRRWEARSWRRLAVLATLPPVIAGLVLVQTRSGILQAGGRGTLGLLKVSRDPTLDLYGWDQVGRELRRRGLLDRPGTFLFTSTWYYSGHVGFATRDSSTPVLCYNSWDARSFRFWSEPRDWLGQDGILISLNLHPAEPSCYDRYFRKIEPLGEFAIERAGAPVRKVRLFRCSQQVEPFPFDGYELSSATRAIARMPGRRSGDGRDHPGRVGR